MKRGVFFDLFGTLLIYTDSRKAWEDWLLVLYENFKNFGLKGTKESFAMRCNGFFSKPEPKFNTPNLTIFEGRIYALADELGLESKTEEIKRTATEAVKAWQKHVPLDPDAIPVLDALKKNKTLALVSNFDHPPHVYSLLSTLNLQKFFDSIVISSEVGVKKPDPLIFSYALKQTNLKPKEVFYVGDTVEDIKAALNSKISPILIQREEFTGDELLYDYSTEKSILDNSNLIKGSNKLRVIKSLKDLIEIV